MMQLSAHNGPSDGVDSREALAAHIRNLRADLIEHGDDWENPTLESYLEALAAWINDSPGWYKNFDQKMPPNGDWTLFARALSAAVVYE
ncbi:hypothetical protein OH805_18910 [Streptomyces sp. NBC_00879]|uniref:DUF7660 family protein n=1 Tax=Streptomyces sp. NBC_00879 TaxID=2975855 RepID=UPI003866F0D4|nr:hypothetical protein OH805_18910 [Streptomyces sp. NBC_00879]